MSGSPTGNRSSCQMDFIFSTPSNGPYNSPIKLVGETEKCLVALKEKSEKLNTR